MGIVRQLCLATALAAIGPVVAGTPVIAQEMKAEVLHWWTSAGESASIKVFADEFTKEGGTWVDTAIAGGNNARTAGINRIAGGNPPTVMQFNTGKQFDELVANGLLRPIDDVATAGHWKDVLPGTIIKAITRDGQIYAVPVNIHGQNWLWYNTKIFADAGVAPPDDFDELIAAAPKLREKGVIPLGQSGVPNYERILFDAVFLSKAGGKIFQSVYGDVNVDAAAGPEFRAAADTFAKLRDLTDPGSPGRNWNDTTGLVITGKAATQVVGDWAKGEFIAAGMTPGKEYGCNVLPGGFVIGGDVFVLPKMSDAAATAAQTKMAELVMSPAMQIAFSTKKGSVPVRTDVDVSGMDLCAQKGMAQLQDPAMQVPSINLLSSPDLVGATTDVITQFWNSKDMSTDAFIQKFVGAMKAAS